MIRAVIFDVDGTLVTFTFDIVGTRSALIGELLGRGYSTTNLTTTTLTQVLKKGGLMDVFELILTRDDVPAMKPKPDGILRALDLFNLSKDELLCVGDSVIDIQAADAAGVRVASVATGNYSRERLLAEGRDLIMSSISELPALLHTLS